METKTRLTIAGVTAAVITAGLWHRQKIEKARKEAVREASKSTATTESKK